MYFFFVYYCDYNTHLSPPPQFFLIIFIFLSFQLQNPPKSFHQCSHRKQKYQGGIGAGRLLADGHGRGRSIAPHCGPRPAPCTRNSPHLIPGANQSLLLQQLDARRPFNEINDLVYWTVRLKIAR